MKDISEFTNESKVKQSVLKHHLKAEDEKGMMNLFHIMLSIIKVIGNNSIDILCPLFESFIHYTTINHNKKTNIAYKKDKNIIRPITEGFFEPLYLKYSLFYNIFLSLNIHAEKIFTLPQGNILIYYYYYYQENKTQKGKEIYFVLLFNKMFDVDYYKEIHSIIQYKDNVFFINSNQTIILFDFSLKKAIKTFHYNEPIRGGLYLKDKSFLVYNGNSFWNINLNSICNETKIKTLGNVDDQIIQFEQYSRTDLVILFTSVLIIWRNNKIAHKINPKEEHTFEFFYITKNLLLTYQFNDGYYPITSVFNIKDCSMIYSVPYFMIEESNIINTNSLICHHENYSNEMYYILQIETGEKICNIYFPFKHGILTRSCKVFCIKLNYGLIVLYNDDNYIYLFDQI